MSLTVKTVPAETDPSATAIGRHLVANLLEAGVDAELVPMDESGLLRDVLVNHDFDLYVTRHPGMPDPDALRPLVHSQFSTEPGWQNPFGYADLDVDELLDEQRNTAGPERRRIVSTLQEKLARTQPVTPVVAAEKVRALRTDRIGTGPFGLDGALGHLSLGGAGEEPPETVRVIRTDGRVTKNLNPLSVEFRARGTLTGLLYDPLGRRVRDGVQPWLAERWEWTDTHDGATVSVRLREAVEWHDGRRVDAEDVAFTYRFLTDTALGDTAVPVAAPRFRGRTSLVASVEVVDARTCRLHVDGVDPVVAERALTVPILPAHVWRERSEEADLAGLDLYERTTEALVWTNPEPVGSGPLRFVERTPGERLVLERVDDHFAVGVPDDVDGDTPRLAAASETPLVPYRYLNVRVAPSSSAALELLSAGDADLLSTRLQPTLVPRATRLDDVGLIASRDRTVYHVGFNVRRQPLNNARFRRTVARLIDKDYLATSAFRGFATPATSLLASTDWLPSSLAWDGEDPEVPFLGDGGDVDPAAVERAFRENGFDYRENGDLVAG